MRIPRHQNNSGIALIIVMIIVVVFAMLAAGLAYSMKVETKLARNANWDTQLEWLGRSGVELAKFVLATQPPGGQQYEALNQKWAGGTGETNDALENISLTDNQLGPGTFSVRITDADRKFNINLAAQRREIVIQALILMGVDAVEAPSIVNAIIDWTDRDDNSISGSDTESSYYESLPSPYRAKNGPIDDITELMMIKGITPAMFFGSGGGGGVAANSGMRVSRMADRLSRARGEEPMYPVGFVDLFTTISAPLININTADATVMQLIPDVDGALASAIIQTRNGPDGAQGNEDDMPFRGIGELANVPGMTREIGAMFSRYFSVRSSTFEVEVEAQIDQYKRTYYAVVRKTGNQIVTLFMYWR